MRVVEAPQGYDIPRGTRVHYLEPEDRSEDEGNTGMLLEFPDGRVVTFDDWAGIPTGYYCAHNAFCSHCGRRLAHAHG